MSLRPQISAINLVSTMLTLLTEMMGQTANIDQSHTKWHTRSDWTHFFTCTPIHQFQPQTLYEFL